MATFGHLAAAALIARLATRPEDSRLQRIQRLAGASAWAVAPDLDLALRLVGVPRGNGVLSHRGASHAVILGPIVTLEDADGTSYNFAWYGRTLGSHVLTMPLKTPTWTSAPGTVPGLNLATLTHLHLQLDPSDYAGSYTVEWQDLSLTGAIPPQITAQREAAQQ